MLCWGWAGYGALGPGAVGAGGGDAYWKPSTFLKESDGEPLSNIIDPCTSEYATCALTEDGDMGIDEALAPRRMPARRTASGSRQRPSSRALVEVPPR